ncbi:hypothetical protein QYE76_049782 [Lolium multiflorum]|uniref:Uncharacterized protein n=1 Tax=Lolium multiflorum TaxID=4521 RepID=A0AAD8SQR4_LOLMU|nr:hypothetical protein QYE76_049782 [Lolium multiflorum]
MLKEFISTQTAFNKSVEEKLDKINILASKVDRLASDVDLLKLKVMPNNDIDNKITTTANAIQVRINENIRLMAELARWDREENEKLAKENNVAKVWTITTTSNVDSSHVAAPPTINGKIIGVGNVSTPSAKRAKLPEIAKTAETACDKAAEIFSNLGDDDPIAVAHNDLDFDDCHISEVIKFLQKLAKTPNASTINLAFTKHITNALIKAREEKLKLETSIPRKLEDGWEPIIKMRVNDFDCNALCDLGASISVMPKKVYDMLDLPPLKNCYLDVNLADNAKKKPLGRVDNVHIVVNNNLVPVDFVVLDIECNASCPIILGRPFLRTVGATIDMKEGQHKDYLDACSEGSFTSKEVEARWDLLDRIEDNAEGWENDKGYADKPPFEPLPPKEGNEEKEKEKKKKGTKKKKKKKENKKKESTGERREGSQGGPTPHPGAAQGGAPPCGEGTPWPLRLHLFAYLIVPDLKTPIRRTKPEKTIQSRRHRESPIRDTFLHRPTDELPGVISTAVSTAIFTAIGLHDEEGVIHPEAEGSAVAMWFISLSYSNTMISFHVGAGISGVAPHYIPPPSTFNVLLGSYWFDKPWFLTEGNLLLYASHLPLGVSNERVLNASSGISMRPPAIAMT